MAVDLEFDLECSVVSSLEFAMVTARVNSLPRTQSVSSRFARKPRHRMVDVSSTTQHASDCRLSAVRVVT